MILNLRSGTNLTQFRDLDILAGLPTIVFMFMAVLNMKFLIFHSRKYAK
jgi:hypothetical protein